MFLVVASIDDGHSNSRRGGLLVVMVDCGGGW